MEFKLNVPERLVLLKILPKEENFINLRFIREAASVIGLSDKEITECKIVQEGENITFDTKKGLKEKPIGLGERIYTIICEVLEKMDKEKKLSQEYFSIFEKFIEDKKPKVRKSN